MTTTESQIEHDLIKKLCDLKYTYRSDIRDREALEKNFREKFEGLNRVHLTDTEFSRLMEQIISQDVFTAATTLPPQAASSTLFWQLPRSTTPSNTTACSRTFKFSGKQKMVTLCR